MAKKLPPGDRPLKTLERVISKAGLGSRREARSWIAAGRVSVGEETVLDPDRWVDLELDRVRFDGKPLMPKERVYLLLHKPPGYLTTYSDPEKRPTVFDLLPERDGFIFPVGRLDRDSRGLLILTNDSALAERIMNPEHHVPKTYHVTATRPVTDDDLDALKRGIELPDGMTRPALVRRLGEDIAFEITVTEGRNRQIRRMVEAVGNEVTSLVRVAIGGIGIEALPEGAWRPLTEAEVRGLTE
ncbi:MAG TPA: pseudouridine synthase [Thermoanaerobaculia bacterium]|nr:pseudouridine synthase [Thermoanaerobaculia bacterium]